MSSKTNAVATSSSENIKKLFRKLSLDRKGLKKRLHDLTNEAADDGKNILKKELDQISEYHDEDLQEILDSFTTRHQSHHRPIALVSSGGTATDLEVHTVRYLDNFSTGLRGAISVEEFLKRGYAVIHLWREGSAAPYSRVLSQLLGAKQCNHGLSFDALGLLFAGQCSPEESDEMAAPSEAKFKNDDPWLTSTTKTRENNVIPQSSQEDDAKVDASHRMNLTKKILNSTILQTKLRERSYVVKEGMLLTVPFRTVEEYLAKLKLCTEAIHDCQSLGLLYLTAAVSDFHIPTPEKAKHKIQSREYDINSKESDGSDVERSIYFDPNSNVLYLKLSPVPKLLGMIRSDFAPHAFCVSFKLETDKDILFQKARLAMEKYDVHMVIGNELDTRYEKVWVLQKQDAGSIHADDNPSDTNNNINIVELSANDASSSSSNDGLEDAIISHVVEKHFEFIANHYLYAEGNDETNVVPRTALMAGAEAAARHNAYLREKKQRLQNELYWKRVRDVSLNIAGHAIGMYLTYAASTALQRRLR